MMARTATWLRRWRAGQRGVTLMESLIAIGILTSALTMVGMPLFSALDTGSRIRVIASDAVVDQLCTLDVVEAGAVQGTAEVVRVGAGGGVSAPCAGGVLTATEVRSNRRARRSRSRTVLSWSFGSTGC